MTVYDLTKKIALGLIQSKQKGIPSLFEGMPLFTRNGKLNHSDICSGRTFVSLLYVKGYPVAFIEGFKPAELIAE